MKKEGEESKEMQERNGEGGVTGTGTEDGVYKKVEAGEVALALGVGQWR